MAWWDESPAVLELLWKLRAGIKADGSDLGLSYFDDILGESVEKTVRRLIEDGVLDKPDPTQFVRVHTVKELKVHLRASGLKVSGKRELLEQRLLGEGFDYISAKAKEAEWIVPTTAAWSQVIKYRESVKEERVRTETEVIKLLEARGFEEAALRVVQFEARRPIKRGMGINWSEKLVPGMAEGAAACFAVRPKILEGLTENDYAPLQVAAAMMGLWGTGVREMKRWIPDGFVLEHRLGPLEAANMIANSAAHRRRVESFQDLDSCVAGVQVVAIRDAVCCEHCSKNDGMMFPVDRIPELPHASCTSDYGCRCCVIAVMDLDWEDLERGDLEVTQRFFGYLKGPDAPKNFQEAVTDGRGEAGHGRMTFELIEEIAGKLKIVVSSVSSVDDTAFVFLIEVSPGQALVGTERGVYVAKFSMFSRSLQGFRYEELALFEQNASNSGFLHLTVSGSGEGIDFILDVKKLDIFSEAMKEVLKRNENCQVRVSGPPSK